MELEELVIGDVVRTSYNDDANKTLHAISVVNRISEDGIFFDDLVALDYEGDPEKNWEGTTDDTTVLEMLFHFIYPKPLYESALEELHSKYPEYKL